MQNPRKRSERVRHAKTKCHAAGEKHRCDPVPDSREARYGFNAETAPRRVIKTPGLKHRQELNLRDRPARLMENLNQPAPGATRPAYTITLERSDIESNFSVRAVFLGRRRLGGEFAHGSRLFFF